MKTRLLSLLLVMLASVMPMKLWAADGNAEPYAVLSDNNTKLTFYYDDQREARGGMSVAGSFDHPNYQPWYSQRESITSAEFDPSFANCTTLTSTAYWFLECKNMVSISGIEYLKTDNVTDMWGMFGGCSGLTSLDLSGFNTANVKSMGSMFEGCSGLTKIFAGDDWNTALVTDGGSMFSGCTSLVGGAGTAYDANHTDHTYAHIDGGAANPGYFTAKDGQTDDDPLLARLYDNLALTTTDGNAEGGNNDLGGSIDAAQTSLVRAMWNLQELPTDESYCVWMDAGIPVLNTNTWSNSTQTDAMKGLYARLYHGIILANNYLANQHDGDLGKQAEARFLRALQYYYLMDHFGNVPLLTDTIDRQPLPVWEATPSDIELLTREEMFSYIENELQESLNSLPATNSYGRATATAARLLLARLYLNSEVYTGTARWQEARSYAESVINGGTFQLAPIYRNLFMGDNDSNGAQQEIILPAIYDGNTRTDYGGTTFLVASSFTNGEGDNGTTQVWAGNVSKPDFVNKFFTQTVDIPYASPEQTASAAGDDRALFYGINHSYELRNGDSFSDGFPYQKFTNVRSNGTSPVSSKFADTDFPLMRLGEAYLIAAEADARLNGSATSMQGTQYINMLRNRANAATSTAGYSLSDICDEWSREMGYEAVRRTTLIRFGRFGGQADYSWAWKGGSYDGTAFDAVKNTYPIPAVAVGGTPEPYAVLSQDSLTVTFYYDDQKASRGGIDFNNRPIVRSSGEKNPYGSAVTAIFDSSFANDTTLTSTAYWFMECRSLAEIRGIANLKTANVTDMGYMFYGCSGLTSLDVSGFNTANVTNMERMFGDCSSLTSLDLSGFNTANVTDMYYMFEGCSALKTIYSGSGWTTNAVTDGNDMFSLCTSLVGGAGTVYDANHVDYTYAHIDGGASNPGYFTDKNAPVATVEPYAVLSDNNTVLTFYYDDQKAARGGMSVAGSFGYPDYQPWHSQAESITSAEFDPSFANCTTLTSTAYWFLGCKNMGAIFGIQYLKTDNVTSMYYMFTGCKNLTSLDVSHFNTANVTSMGSMFSGCSGLTSLDLSVFNTAKVTSMGSMFWGCSGLTSLDVSGFKTDNVTDMYEMFHDCSGLTSLDVSGFNTDKVTNMSSMFYGCSSLTSLDVSHFKTDNVTEMWSMFRDCSGLASLDISGFNTANVTNMESMFSGCSGLTSLDLSGFNTANVTDMYGMFFGCSGLTSLDVSGFNTVNVTSMEFMFSDCSSLTSLDVSGFKTDNVTNMSCMFYKCSGLTSLDVSGFNTENVTNMGGMFYHCSGLTSLDVSGFNTANVTYMSGMFFGCSGLTSLDVSGFNTPNVTDMYGMFDGCSGLTNLDVTNFNTANVTYMSYMFYGCSGLTSLDVSGFNTENVTTMIGMFAGCSGLTSLDVSGFKTDNVTNMDGMFYRCSSLTSLDVSGFKTDNVTNMNGMFYRCSGLTSLDVSEFNTTNVTSMYGMFYGCSSLTSLDVSAFNTANVTDMDGMFYRCPNLTNLDVSGFNTDNVTSMYLMFADCSGLTSLDVSGFKTDNVTNMRYMFYGCSGLTSLDVSGFKTDNVTNMGYMFKGCSALKTIYAGDGWSTASVEQGDSIFYHCTNLIGGAGTPYDSTHVDVSYAHIDGGASNPGYFTDKNAAPVATVEPYAVLSDNNTVLTFYYDDQKEVRGGMSVGPFYMNDSGTIEGRQWNDAAGSITTVVFDNSFVNCTSLTSTYGWFYGCKNLITITDIGNLKTDNVADMSYMFSDCSSLKALNVSGFKTDNVVNIWFMFSGCSSLTSLDVSGFNMGNVWGMNGMFSGCLGLTSIDLGNFNTENVRYMTGLFGECSGLTSLDVSGFNTTNVIDMNSMFRGCSSLTSLDLSKFNTSNVTDLSFMFWRCNNLLDLDISSFNTANAKMVRIFEECSSLASIRAGNANIPAEEYAQVNNPNLLVYVNEASLAPEGVQNVVINGLAREIVLTDAQDGNNDWYAPQAFVAERISYTRNFGQSTTKGTSRGWESIALPFDVQTIQHESKGVIAPFNNSASNKHFWLRRLTDNGLQAAMNIEANTPYIISMPNSEEYTADYNLNGRVTFSAQNIDVPATTTKVLALADSSIVMVPAMQRQSRSSSVWALNVGEVRGQYFEGSVFERDYRTVRPFEAYTIHRQENGQPAPRYVPIQEIAGVTGIETIDREPLTLNQWYDMQGRKLEGKPARKGVYISNGKKVVVK